MTATPQRAHFGASVPIAHSKQSKTCRSPFASSTVNDWSYSLPHRSHLAALKFLAPTRRGASSLCLAPPRGAPALALPASSRAPAERVPPRSSRGRSRGRRGGSADQPLDFPRLGSCRPSHSPFGNVPRCKEGATRSATARSRDEGRGARPILGLLGKSWNAPWHMSCKLACCAGAPTILEPHGVSSLTLRAHPL